MMGITAIARTILIELKTWSPNDIGWPVYMRAMPYAPGHVWGDA